MMAIVRPILDPRLKTLKTWTPRYGRIIDVGADHGKLSLAIAQDLEPAKLIVTERFQNRAKILKNLFPSHEAHIEVRIGDGLSVLIADDQIETAIFAGMGPHTILKAWHRCPADVSPPPHLLLQPQGEPAIVRAAFHEAGYRITREALITSRKRHYFLIELHLTPEGFTETHETLDLDQLLAVGPRLAEQPTAELVEYWHQQLRRNQRAFIAAGRPGPSSIQHRKYSQSKAIYDWLKRAYSP